ncbi:MAG: VCBS repeat-containing protein [Deltaproteobacteria bacterium]|nr:VCBS repeat-containing protein [Deltaproteobacteria bacterium]
MKRLFYIFVIQFLLLTVSAFSQGSVHGSVRISGAPALNQNIAFQLDNKEPSGTSFGTNQYVVLQDIINGTQSNLDFGAGELVNGVYLADLPSSRDGYQDLIVELLAPSSGSGNTKLVGLLNNQSGDFISIPLPVGDSATTNGSSIAHVQSKDVDGDGYEDLFVNDLGTKNIVVDTRNTPFLPSSGIYAYNYKNVTYKIFLSTGGMTTLPIDFEVKDSCIIDVDNDGDNDIVTLNPTLYFYDYNGFPDYHILFSVSVSLNDGNAGFSTSYFSILDSSNKDLKPTLHCQDINGDKLIDLEITTRSYGFSVHGFTIHTALNIGNATFALPTSETYSFSTNGGDFIYPETQLSFEDINNDGFSDLIAYHNNSGFHVAEVYKNKANSLLTSSFFQPGLTIIPSIANFLTIPRIFDFNGDGLLDILFQSSTSPISYNFAFNPGVGSFITNNLAFTLSTPNLTDTWRENNSTEIFDFYGLTNVKVQIGQYTIYTDTAGRFKLTGIPAGTYPLSLSLNGYLFDNQSTITVSNGASTGVDVNATVGNSTPPTGGDSGDSGSSNDGQGSGGSGSSGNSENDFYDLGFSAPPTKPNLNSSGKKLTIDFTSIQYATSHVCKVTEIFKNKSGKKKKRTKIHEFMTPPYTRNVKKGAKVKVACYGKNPISATAYSSSAKIKVKKSKS